MNPAYGLLWWLNRLPVGRSMRGEEVVDATTLIPSAPPDLYAAQGALGRKLYVVPSLDLVVTRLGDQPEAEFNEELWKRLIAAAGG
jgi:CubicO group peptidase (beta-lactamase class C family)